eukprot:140933-Pyramimonas_sp.AAC.1
MRRSAWAKAEEKGMACRAHHAMCVRDCGQCLYPYPVRLGLSWKGRRKAEAQWTWIKIEPCGARF